MKQIVLLGDLDRWKEEADFIIEMLHLTASRVITIHIGPRGLGADLNTKDLYRLYPGQTRDQCIGAALTKLYTQGIADGLFCLVDNEPGLFTAYSSALAALPFGTPKVALLSGDSAWQGGKEIVRFQLPGLEYSINPVIKIFLSNAVFAISGMALCNIHNFGSPVPTVGNCCSAGAASSLKELGINYINFASPDSFLYNLVSNGYIHGLLLSGEGQDWKQLLRAASIREIPVVVACKNPLAVQAALESIDIPISAPVVMVSPHRLLPRCPGSAAAAKSPQGWLTRQPLPYKYGTKPFYTQAVKVLVELMT